MSAVKRAKKTASTASAPPIASPTRPATPPPSPARPGSASVPTPPYPNIRPDGLGLALAEVPSSPPPPPSPPSPPPTPCRDPLRPPLDGERDLIERRFDRRVRAHAAADRPPAPSADGSPPDDAAERLEDVAAAAGAIDVFSGPYVIRGLAAAALELPQAHPDSDSDDEW